MPSRSDQYLAFGHVVLQFSRGHVPAIDEWFLSQHGHVRRIEVIAMNFNFFRNSSSAHGASPPFIGAWRSIIDSSSL